MGGKSLLKNEYGSRSGSKVETDVSSDISMPDVNEALRLAVKVLNKTMDATATSPEKMELFAMTLEDVDGSGNKQCVHKILNKEETQKIIDEVEADAATAGDS